MMTTTNQIRIIIVDDNRVVREGLSIFLKIFEDLDFVGEARSGAEAVKLCDELKPDVVLMDIQMPKMTGIEATKIISEKYPNIKIIGLTSLPSTSPQQQEIVAVGAVACLQKQASIDEILSTIRNALP
ncbi:MAG: response regulator transcription factor [Anaerolineae bacterium]|nr:response regulator transcription factor [Anaerolineae bacterium]MDQ7034893.1 response regulator transcription factor [Anaerolineae bacterium]